jgi:four helix bundle protein
MSRDYRKLRTFHLADELVSQSYRLTRGFPREEVFGLTAQIRRAAVSIPTNIVEGSFRNSEAEYLNFLNIALGSAAELGYLLELAGKLDYLTEEELSGTMKQHSLCIRSLQALISAYRKPRAKPKV